ncbi:MAG: hypothetical protein MUP98_21390, partial [Candidatus Aminicenantes bacterium]|nr:hypothetical protein [Candidatus Aminicenantes bacterium]
SLEILGHRVVWSAVFLITVQVIRNRWDWIRSELKDSKTRLSFIETSCLIGFNWFIYVLAVNSGFIVETSLGYFINPLVSVFLGVLILREHLRALDGLTFETGGFRSQRLVSFNTSFPRCFSSWVSSSIKKRFQ